MAMKIARGLDVAAIARALYSRSFRIAFWNVRARASSRANRLLRLEAVVGCTPCGGCAAAARVSNVRTSTIRERTVGTTGTTIFHTHSQNSTLARTAAERQRPRQKQMPPQSFQGSFTTASQQPRTSNSSPSDISATNLPSSVIDTPGPMPGAPPNNLRPPFFPPPSHPFFYPFPGPMNAPTPSPENLYPKPEGSLPWAPPYHPYAFPYPYMPYPPPAGTPNAQETGGGPPHPFPGAFPFSYGYPFPPGYPPFPFSPEAVVVAETGQAGQKAPLSAGAGKEQEGKVHEETGPGGDADVEDTAAGRSYPEELRKTAADTAPVEQASADVATPETTTEEILPDPAPPAEQAANAGTIPVQAGEGEREMEGNETPGSVTLEDKAQELNVETQPNLASRPPSQEPAELSSRQNPSMAMLQDGETNAISEEPAVKPSSAPDENPATGEKETGDAQQTGATVSASNAPVAAEAAAAGTEDTQGADGDPKTTAGRTRTEGMPDGSRPETWNAATSASLIQAKWRGSQVRASQPLGTLRRLRGLECSAQDLEAKIAQAEGSPGGVGATERTRLGEGVMSLLLALDALSCPPVLGLEGVRGRRRELARGLSKLQERVDALPVVTVTEKDKGDSLASSGKEEVPKSSGENRGGVAKEAELRATGDKEKGPTTGMIAPSGASAAAMRKGSDAVSVRIIPVGGPSGVHGSQGTTAATIPVAVLQSKGSRDVAREPSPSQGTPPQRKEGETSSSLADKGRDPISSSRGGVSTGPVPSASAAGKQEPAKVPAAEEDLGHGTSSEKKGQRRLVFVPGNPGAWAMVWEEEGSEEAEKVETGAAQRGEKQSGGSGKHGEGSKAENVKETGKGGESKQKAKAAEEQGKSHGCPERGLKKGFLRQENAKTADRTRCTACPGSKQAPPGTNTTTGPKGLGVLEAENAWLRQQLSEHKALQQQTHGLIHQLINRVGDLEGEIRRQKGLWEEMREKREAAEMRERRRRVEEGQREVQGQVQEMLSEARGEGQSNALLQGYARGVPRGLPLTINFMPLGDRQSYAAFPSSWSAQEKPEAKAAQPAPRYVKVASSPAASAGAEEPNVVWQYVDPTDIRIEDVTPTLFGSKIHQGGSPRGGRVGPSSCGSRYRPRVQVLGEDGDSDEELVWSPPGKECAFNWKYFDPQDTVTRSAEGQGIPVTVQVVPGRKGSMGGASDPKQAAYFVVPPDVKFC